MKVLFPAVTCLVGSHLKPYLRDALGSVLAQTRRDIQIVVVDSGQWIGNDDDRSQAMAAVHRDFAGHPLIEWVTTGEGIDFRSQKCPIGYVTNEAIRAGLIRGKYMCTFYDDDVYGPRFMQRMAGYLDDHPQAGAVWCSQDRMKLAPDGVETKVGTIVADAPKYGATFDCRVDGAQIMWRTEILDKIGGPWLPEDPNEAVCRHSDGIFLDKLGVACGMVPNIPEVLLRHRFTPISTYTRS